LDISTAIIEVLSRGPHDGDALFREVVRLHGDSPSHVDWRSTLIDLTQKTQIERHVIRDDDEKVLGVNYKLPHGTTMETGENNEHTERTR
jgi:hypothetical protein